MNEESNSEEPPHIIETAVVCVHVKVYTCRPVSFIRSYVYKAASYGVLTR